MIILLTYVTCRPGVVRVLEEFKTSIYGENYDEEIEHGTGKPTEASKKRKAHTEFAKKECEGYDWGELADTGKVNLAFFLHSGFGLTLGPAGLLKNIKPMSGGQYNIFKFSAAWYHFC